MLLLLKCVGMPDRAPLPLRAGQRGRVGSSPWVELSVPGSDLQPEHFRVECQGAPQLVCFPDCVIQWQGEPLTELELQHGMTFAAGSCQFEVSLCGQVVRTPQRVESAASAVPTPPAQWWKSETWQVLDCPPELASRLQQQATARQAVDVLVSAGYPFKAVRLLALLLPPVAAVAWTVTSAYPTSAPSPSSTSSTNASADVLAWLNEPGEERRQQIAVATDPLSVAEWIAQAVVWTGGSLTPPDAPPVPPPAHLCGLACSTALQLLIAGGQAAITLDELIAGGVRVLEASQASLGSHLDQLRSK